MMTSISPVMSCASIVTRDAVRSGSVQTCSAISISIKGWLKSAFVDNNRPHDSLRHRGTLFQHISVYSSAKSNRKSTKMLQSCSTFLDDVTAVMMFSLLTRSSSKICSSFAVR